jgi:hypothetical protein
MRALYCGMLGRAGKFSSRLYHDCHLLLELHVPESPVYHLTRSEAAQMSIWSLVRALVLMSRKSKTFYSKKYGIGLIRFTHRSGNILHTSTKGDHAVRYHSMHDNKYLSYFRGHENTLVSSQFQKDMQMEGADG